MLKQDVIASESEIINSRRTRLVVASALGTAIEWYDFFLYALIAPLIFDSVFFPKLDQFVAMLLVFSTFAVGFIARPLGGVLFGHYGDRFGRKSVLVATILVMGFSSFSIGLLPGYAAIGILAPILLVCLRFLQGLALGGESIGALVLTIESVPRRQRGFYASLIQTAGPIGVVASSAIVSVLSANNAEFRLGRWRLAFLLSAVLVWVGVYLRKTVDIPLMNPRVIAGPLARTPLEVVLRRWKVSSSVAFAVCLAETAYFYLTTIFAIAYGSKVLGISHTWLTSAFFFANCVAAVVVPVLGAASDRLGRRPLLITGFIAAALFLYPFFALLQTRKLWVVGAAMVVSAGFIHPMIFAAEGSFIPELFDSNVRFTGASLGKQMGTVLGGGLAPLVATALLARSKGDYRLVVIYFAVMAVLAIVACIFTRETAPTANEVMLGS